MPESEQPKPDLTQQLNRLTTSMNRLIPFLTSYTTRLDRILQRSIQSTFHANTDIEAAEKEMDKNRLTFILSLTMDTGGVLLLNNQEPLAKGLGLLISLPGVAATIYSLDGYFRSSIRFSNAIRAKYEENHVALIAEHLVTHQRVMAMAASEAEETRPNEASDRPTQFLEPLEE